MESDDSEDTWLADALARSKDAATKAPAEPNGAALAQSRKAAEDLWASVVRYLQRGRSTDS